MTIAISIKVNDGVVIASDSATTMVARDPKGNIGIMNIYQNADKIFNLRKETPVGAITWGSGSIGNSSISTLSKDFRNLISSNDEKWKVDPEDYSIEDIAIKYKKFMFDDNYEKAFKDWEKETKPFIGFIIVGYSKNGDFAEEWEIQIVNGECEGPKKIREDNLSGISWRGRGEAVYRLYFGVANNISLVLSEMGLDDDLIKKIVENCINKLKVPLVAPAMPIQDAIDLAKFLVQMTIHYFKFSPGAQIVGGPIDIAAITKHEGFKWVQRKHYFEKKYNPLIKKES